MGGAYAIYTFSCSLSVNTPSLPRIPALPWSPALTRATGVELMLLLANGGSCPSVRSILLSVSVSPPGRLPELSLYPDCLLEGVGSADRSLRFFRRFVLWTDRSRGVNSCFPNAVCRFGSCATDRFGVRETAFCRAPFGRMLCLLGEWKDSITEFSSGGMSRSISPDDSSAWDELRKSPPRAMAVV
jgi:hypothetical protein